MALGASGLVLALSWGGTEYPWGSGTIIGLLAGSVLALALFVLAEARAAEPILPLRLFRGSVFTISVVLAFVVGFAMLGAMTFLPTYLQYVKGVSATDSGVRTLPLVLGLLVTSIASGIVVSRTGRYKIFPVAGTLVMTLGLYLLSRLDASSGTWIASLDMLVLGAGIGLCMQVLTIIVQNTADFRDLGVVTSAVTFFRTLGSSFGVAIFGTVYSNALGTRLSAAFAQASGLNPAAVATPKLLHAHPSAQIAPIVDAYAHALHVVFLAAVPVGLAGFVLALFLKQVPLRDSSRAGASDVGGGFGMPDSADSSIQLQGAIARLLRSQRPENLAALREASGSELNTADGWCVSQVHVRERLDRDTSLTAIAQRVRVPRSRAVARIRRHPRGCGYLTGTEERLTVTPLGRDRAGKARRRRAGRGWPPSLPTGAQPTTIQLHTALTGLARRLVDDDPQPLPLLSSPNTQRNRPGPAHMKGGSGTTRRRANRRSHCLPAAAVPSGRPRPARPDNRRMLRLGTIVLNVKDARRASQFWSQALGYAYRDGGYSQDTTPVLLPQPATAVAIALEEDDRTHLDLHTDSAPEQQAEVERRYSSGPPGSTGHTPTPRFVVLADPDGNLFCVVNTGRE